MDWCKKHDFEVVFEGDFYKRSENMGAKKTRHFKLAKQRSGSMRLIFSWTSVDQSRNRPSRPHALYDITNATFYSVPNDLSITVINVISFSGLEDFQSSRKSSGVLKGFLVQPVNVLNSKKFKEALRGSGKHIMPTPPGEKQNLRRLRRTQGDEKRLTMTRAERARLEDGYQLIGVLGSGGFATVYRGIQKATGNEVAVKIFLEEKAAASNEDSQEVSSSDSSAEDEEDIDAYVSSSSFQRKCFEWEIHVMQRLKQELGEHQNIVKLFQVCTSMNPLGTCVVMEMLNGGELFDKLVERSYFTDTDAAKLFKTMALTLRDIHEAGVLHRDLKPENIIFMGDTLKVADFGTARLIDEPNEDPFKRFRVGSPGYSAPEVMRFDYTPACDVFSLGVILHLMLVGFSPFEGVEDTPGAIFVRMVQNSYDFDRQEWANIDPDAVNLIRKMLLYNKRDRFTLDQVLQHKWLRNGRRPSNNHLGQTLLRIEDYRRQRKAHRVHTVQSIYQARQRLKQEITQRKPRGTGGFGQSGRNLLRGVQKLL